MSRLRRTVQATWLIFVRQLSRYPTKENVFEAYVRTLIGDFIVCQERVPIEEIISIHGSQYSSSDLDKWLWSALAAYWKVTDPLMEQLDPEYRDKLSGMAQNGVPQYFHKMTERYCSRRCFFLTEKGYMGLGPRGTRIGDHVVVLTGSRVPYILHETLNARPEPASQMSPAGFSDEAIDNASSWFEFVGECYVHGIMFGEAFDEEIDGGLRREMFDMR